MDCDSSALEDCSGNGFMKWIKEKFPHYLFLYFLNLHKKKNRTQTEGQSWLARISLSGNIHWCLHKHEWTTKKTWVHIVQYFVYSINYLFFIMFVVILLSFGCNICRDKEMFPFAGQIKEFWFWFWFWFWCILENAMHNEGGELPTSHCMENHCINSYISHHINNIQTILNKENIYLKVLEQWSIKSGDCLRISHLNRQDCVGPGEIGQKHRMRGISNMTDRTQDRHIRRSSASESMWSSAIVT